jgi:hypothetical protein
MSYIGSSAAPLPVAFAGQQGQSFNGGTNTFTLSRAVSRTLDIDVVINNVAQNPYDGSYSVNGTTLTTAETVSAGVGNVYVIYRDAPIGSLVDVTAVSLNGDQAVAGIKTFTNQPVMSAGISLGANGQIKFPATQNPSGDANTLDDYEEGTWTPTILGTVTNPTSQTFSGIATYVKVGRLVWVGLAGVFTHSGGSGDFYITGLPFTTSADGTTPSGTPALLRNVTWTGGYACTHLRANTPNIELWGVANGGNYTRVPLSGFNGGGWEIYMNTTYRSAS